MAKNSQLPPPPLPLEHTTPFLTLCRHLYRPRRSFYKPESREKRSTCSCTRRPGRKPAELQKSTIRRPCRTFSAPRRQTLRQRDTGERRRIYTFALPSQKRLYRYTVCVSRCFVLVVPSRAAAPAQSPGRVQEVDSICAPGERGDISSY